MKRKSMKKAFAAAVSAAMVMSMPMGAMASSTPSTTPTPAPNSAEVDAPIYSFDVVNVVVPTSLVVAFNPDELKVETGGTTPSTEQVLSQNFGILNKSNKDKIVTVTLKVEDLNDDQISFVDTDDAAKDAAEGEYAVHLAVVPADTTEVQVGGASADESTDAAAIAKVEMTKAAAGKEVTLAAGSNTIAFVLQKATYEPAAGGGITLGSGSNDVQNNLELTNVATGGKGITAFTFAGALNQKAEWSKLDKGIKITAVYDFETTYDYAGLTDATDGSIASGTGAMLDKIAPKFSAGSAVGTIRYTVGIGDDSLDSIKSIEMLYGSDPFDGYNAGANWEAADDEDGLITLKAGYINAYVGAEPDVATKEATITYTTVGGDEKTATVNVKLK